MYTVYGIPNCTTIRKAIDWLQANSIVFTFHDYKKQGISKEQLQEWAKQQPAAQLLNTRGTTWRSLADADKAAAARKPGAIRIMHNQPSIIKRPIIEQDGRIVAVGFDPAQYQAIFK